MGGASIQVTVYVDKGRIPYGRMLMCHMVADTLDELHAMAQALGLKRRWFQEHPALPHYDICQSKRAQAIGLGAVEIGRKELVKRIREHRASPN